MTKNSFERNTLQTENPYTAQQVTLFCEGSSKWIWFGDTNITAFKRGDLSLLVPEETLNSWEYSEQGNTYDLPRPLLITWRQETGGKSGRPYKKILSIVSGLVDIDTAVAINLSAPQLEPAHREPFANLLPEVAEAPGDELLRIAPLLGAADRTIDELGKQARALEQAAMDAVRDSNPALYERLDAQKAIQTELELKARKLLEMHRQATGEHGRILEGYYTLIRKETPVLKPKVSEAHLLRWLVLNALHLLRKVVQIDFVALQELIAHNGKPLPAFVDMPVCFETLVHESSRIEWSKLPKPESIAPLVLVEASANGHGESASE